MRLITAAIAVIGLSLAGCGPAPSTDADWTLAADQSGMTYVTIKNNILGEINTFREITGGVTADGHAQVNIDLNSVDTNNEIRDGRMKTHLFDAPRYPAAKISAKIDMRAYDALAVGDSRTELLELTLDLHGIELEQEVYVLVTRLGEDKVVVATKAPVLLDAEDFGFEAGLAKLQELASLDSITPVVPVTVSFVFER